MRVGLDVFTIRHLNLDPLHTLDFIYERNFAGAQFGSLDSMSPKLDEGFLLEVKQHADSRGLYVHVSVPVLNPHAVVGSLSDHTEALTRQIKLCHKLGFRDVHTTLGSEQNRLNGSVPWAKQLRDSQDYIQSFAPLLRDTGVRLSLEDHGDTTTFELIRIIEDVGPDIVSICLDTANLFVNLEDPLAAAKRAAPYVKLTHAKDAVLFFGPKGLERQVRPVGKGGIPWEELLTVLGRLQPNLTLSVEDHKEMPFTPDIHSYTLPIYESAWLDHYPDVTATELARLVRTATQCEAKMERGQLPPPEAYSDPWEHSGEERLAESRDYLNQLIAKLNLGE